MAKYSRKVNFTTIDTFQKLSQTKLEQTNGGSSHSHITDWTDCFKKINRRRG